MNLPAGPDFQKILNPSYFPYTDLSLSFDTDQESILAPLGPIVTKIDRNHLAAAHQLPADRRVDTVHEMSQIRPVQRRVQFPMIQPFRAQLVRKREKESDQQLDRSKDEEK